MVNPYVSRRRQKQREAALLFGGAVIVLLSVGIGLVAWRWSKPVVPVQVGPVEPQSHPVAGPRPFVNPLTGSVPLVVKYLEQHANDPDIDYVEWGEPFLVPSEIEDPYWVVDVKARVKNQFGAKILRSLTFEIRNGKVVRSNLF